MHIPRYLFLFFDSTRFDLSAIPVNLRSLVPEHNGVLPLEDHKSAIEALLAEALAFDHLAAERCEARAPADGQAPPELSLDTRRFLVQLAATLVRALVHCVHGTAEEEPDRLVDVLLRRDRGEGELGQRLRDAYYGF